MRLYELANEYKFLQEELFDEETGEVNETSLARINEIKDTAENKCINLVRILKDMEVELEAIESERKKLQYREKKTENNLKRLKDYLLTNMISCDIKKISCPQFVITLRKNQSKLEMINESMIPEEYLRIKTEVHTDNAKIKEDLKNGMDVPGAKLVESYSVILR